MKKSYTVLILDDNKLVGKCIQERIFRLTEQNESKPTPDIIPIYLTFDHKNIQQIKNEVETAISRADFLLLDNFHQEFEEENPIDNEHLYVKKVGDISKINFNIKEEAFEYLKAKGVEIHTLLPNISGQAFKNLKQVILYTYSPYLNQNEIAERKYRVKEAIKANLESDKIDILVTGVEIYAPAKFELYKVKDGDKNMFSVGIKSDYRLYGLFVGEILYHRMIYRLLEEERANVKEKKTLLMQKIPLLFLIFVCLSVGSSALFELIKPKIPFEILTLGIIVGVIIPIIVLFFRPNLLVPFDEN